ncbi:MAG: 2-hydroxychromene-2-carboxylate isomerase [Alphaproteobacteria bacterium]|nr:2-hydroxychromene-2-carboxylate isomerase [Alphaproteobacteria bacterium]MCY4319915.1 2-hydroxychromene-2-carboxylate isomerase [Alphaproteobacteria bacterium]
MPDEHLSYYFTMASPWTYLGHDEAMALCRKHGVAVDILPVDLTDVFSVSGGLPLPQRAPQRRAYRLVELQRWRARRGAVLNLHPKYFPAPADRANCMVVAAVMGGLDAAVLARALMGGVWAEDRNIADDGDLTAIADANGFDGAALLAEAGSQAVQCRYRAQTERAKAAGVFGAPTYVWRGEPFWGQDRLDFLARALAGETEPIALSEEV